MAFRSRLRCLSLAVLFIASSASAQLPVQQSEPPTDLAAQPEAEPLAADPPVDQATPAPDPVVPAPAPAPPAVAPAPVRAVAPARPAPPKAAPSSGRRLNWTYPRFRWWEYVAAGAVTVGNISMEIAYQAQPKERWYSPALFDGAVRDLVRTTNKDRERLANAVADNTWYAVQYYVLLDGIVTPLVSDKLNGDVALQLTLLNWQAVGLTGLLARLTHVAVGRTRPSLQGCSKEPGAANPCEFRGASFLSGHAAMATASAGLGCMNHRYLPLYGGGVADAIVCPVLLTGAATVGVLRVVSDKHWVTDVIAGWALGGVLGFGLPYFLHYSPSAVKTALQPTPSTVFVPWADESSGGLRFMGLL